MKVILVTLLLLLLLSQTSSAPQRRKAKATKEKEHDYYELLRLKKSATSAEIKKAYKTQARKYHPDKNPDDPKAQGRFVLIAEAYGVLNDEEKRKIYDKQERPTLLYGKKGLEVKEKGGDPRYSGGGGSGSRGGGGGGGFSGGFPGGGFPGGGFPGGGFPGGGFPGGGGGGGGFQFNFGGGGGGGGGGRRPPPNAPKKPSSLFSTKDIKRNSNLFYHTHNSFPSPKTSPHFHILLFCSSACNSAAELKKNFIELSQKIEGFARAGVVDCSQSANSRLCDSHGYSANRGCRIGVIGTSNEIDYMQQFDLKSMHTKLKNAIVLGSGVANVNRLTDITTKMLGGGDGYVDKMIGKLFKNGKKKAILLLTSKYETSLLWTSLAWEFKKTIPLGESRGANLKLSKRFGVKKYPFVVCVEEDSNSDDGFRVVENFGGEVKRRELKRWIERLTGSVDGGRKKKKKAEL